MITELSLLHRYGNKTKLTATVPEPSLLYRHVDRKNVYCIDKPSLLHKYRDRTKFIALIE